MIDSHPEGALSGDADGCVDRVVASLVKLMA